MSFGSAGGNTSRQNQTRQYFLIVLPSVSVTFALWLLPLHWQRFVFPPADKMVSGPLYGGALLIVPPFIVFFYIMFALGISEMLQRRRRLSSVGKMPIGGVLGVIALAVIAPCAMAYAYGISAYWFATPDGVTIHSGWNKSVLYPWSAATERDISCFTSKGGSRNVHFEVKFSDGRTVDIADTQQLEFEKHFAQLSALTASAIVGEMPPNPRPVCPAFILQFIADHRSR